MTPTRDEILSLIRLQVGELTYIQRYENSLRLGYLRERASRLIELIDAMPEKERTNFTGISDGDG